jgi:hypothetical protein
MAVLRRYRIWAGEPPYREMERRTSQQGTGARVAASTLCNMLNRNRLPRLDTFTAAASACGANPHDLERFVSAWRQVKLGELA